MSYNLNELGIRERLKYKDISWLMSSIDVENVLNRLGTTVSSKSGHVLRALCPDHRHPAGSGPVARHPAVAGHVPGAGVRH